MSDKTCHLFKKVPEDSSSSFQSSRSLGCGSECIVLCDEKTPSDVKVDVLIICVWKVNWHRITRDEFSVGTLLFLSLISLLSLLWGLGVSIFFSYSYRGGKAHIFGSNPYFPNL